MWTTAEVTHFDIWLLNARMTRAQTYAQTPLKPHDLKWSNLISVVGQESSINHTNNTTLPYFAIKTRLKAAGKGVAEMVCVLYEFLYDNGRLYLYFYCNTPKMD